MDQSALQDRGEMCTFDLGVNCPFKIEKWSSKWTAFSPKLHATITWRVIFTMWPSAAWRPSQWTSEQTGVITVSCSSTVPPSLPSSLPPSLPPSFLFIFSLISLQLYSLPPVTCFFSSSSLFLPHKPDGWAHAGLLLWVWLRLSSWAFVPLFPISSMLCGGR